MLKNSLSLFLFLIAVGVGHCSAQAAEKNFYLVEGLFFEGMPPGVGYGKIVRFIDHEDEQGHKATELRLAKGQELPEDVKRYATPADEVPGGEALLMSSRGRMGKGFPVAVAATLKSEKWLGEHFPDFNVKDTNGRIWTNADVAGKPLVLNFWYTGCGPCILEMPELNSWMELFPDATYLATTFDSADRIKKIVENRPFHFTQIADELFFFKIFNVSGMPVTILVDKKGVIRHIEEGSGGAKLRYMRDKLEELSKE